MTDLADMGSVQAAYIAAKTVLVAANQVKAEKQLLGLPQTIQKADFTSTERTFDKAFGRQPSNRVLGISIIERIEMDMQNGLLVAPRLNERPSREEVEKACKDKVDAGGMAISYTSTGAKLQVPIKVKLVSPQNTEEFRERIDLQQ